MKCQRCKNKIEPPHQKKIKQMKVKCTKDVYDIENADAEKTECERKTK